MVGRPPPKASIQNPGATILAPMILVITAECVSTKKLRDAVKAVMTRKAETRNPTVIDGTIVSCVVQGGVLMQTVSPCVTSAVRAAALRMKLSNPAVLRINLLNSALADLSAATVIMALTTNLPHK